MSVEFSCDKKCSFCPFQQPFGISRGPKAELAKMTLGNSMMFRLKRVYETDNGSINTVLITKDLNRSALCHQGLNDSNVFPQVGEITISVR